LTVDAPTLLLPGMPALLKKVPRVSSLEFVFGLQRRGRQTLVFKEEQAVLISSA
jgi:hypothetical protein